MSSPAVKACPVCAEEIRLAAKACRYCGAVLTEEALPAFLPPEVRRAWDEYEAKLAGIKEPGTQSELGASEIVDSLFQRVGVDFSAQHRQRFEKLLNSVTEQYRSASVMFVDVTSYTSMCQRLNPEQVKSILDAYYTVCNQVVDFYNGLVVKFQGDGCLAVFGAPIAYDRDAESAVRAAMEIQRRVRAFPVLYGEKIRCSVGVETGEVLSSVIRTGSPTYDIFGPAVNLAARIQGVAESDTVVIGPATHDLVRKDFRFRKNSPKQLKNVDKPVVTYIVLATRQKAETAQGAPNPFIGRRPELAAIKEQWTAFTDVAASGEAAAIPQGIRLVGESGVGKSRLIAEFASTLTGTLQYFVDSAPHGIKLPWGMWKRFFGVVCGAAETDAEHVVRKRFAKLLASLAFPADQRAHLLAVLGDEKAAQSLVAVPPSTLRKMIGASISALLEALSRDQPAYMIIEDVQWSDPTSTEILNAVMAAPAPHRCFFMLSYRTDFELNQPNIEKLPELQLSGLDSEHRKSMLLSLLLPAEAYLDIPTNFVEDSSGNPFHIIEIARALEEQISQAKTDADRQRVFQQMQRLVPLSVKGMLQSRVDNLEPHKKQVLQCGAVIGRRFSYPFMEMYPFIRDGLLANLYGLKSQDLINDDTEGAVLEFYFQHNAVREVAYQSLLERQRRDLHRILATKLDGRTTEPTEEELQLIAYHYAHTDDHEKAATYLKKAGDLALRVAATREAIDYYSGTLEHLRQVDQPEKFADMRLAVLRAKGRLHLLSGEAENAIQALTQGAELARELKRRSDLGWLHMLLAYTYNMTSKYDMAQAELEEAVVHARREKDKALLGMIWNQFGLCAWGRGDVKSARENYARTAKLGLEETVPGIAADVANNAALCEWKAGQLNAAASQFERALELYGKAGNKYGTTVALMNLAIIEENTGMYREAERHYVETLSMAESIRFQQVLTAVHSNVANLCLAEDRGKEACEHSEKSLKVAELIGDRRSAAIALENLSLGHLLQQDLEHARKSLRESRKIAQEIQDAERVFSLSLVDIEIALASGAGVSTNRISKAMQELASGAYESEKPRLLRLVACAYMQQQQFPEASGALHTALDEAVRQNNKTEERRIRNLIDDHEDVLQNPGDGSHSSADDHVHIVDFNPRWRSDYEAEAPQVCDALGLLAKEVHHVGSTAVEGISAKPLIDIMVGVEELGEIERYRQQMEALGYTVQPIDDTDRYCFKKGLPRTHHVHIVQIGQRHYNGMLNFRDYLRAHPETAHEYVELKRALAREFGKRRELYTQSKTAFIREVLAHAQSTETVGTENAASPAQSGAQTVG